MKPRLAFEPIPGVTNPFALVYLRESMRRWLWLYAVLALLVAYAVWWVKEWDERMFGNREPFKLTHITDPKPIGEYRLDRFIPVRGAPHLALGEVDGKWQVWDVALERPIYEVTSYSINVYDDRGRVERTFQPSFDKETGLLVWRAGVVGLGSAFLRIAHALLRDSRDTDFTLVNAESGEIVSTKRLKYCLFPTEIWGRERKKLRRRINSSMLSYLEYCAILTDGLLGDEIMKLPPDDCLISLPNGGLIDFYYGYQVRPESRLLEPLDPETYKAYELIEYDFPRMTMTPFSMSIWPTRRSLSALAPGATARRFTVALSPDDLRAERAVSHVHRDPMNARFIRIGDSPSKWYLLISCDSRTHLYDALIAKKLATIAFPDGVSQQLQLGDDGTALILEDGVPWIVPFSDIPFYFPPDDSDFELEVVDLTSVFPGISALGAQP